MISFAGVSLPCPTAELLGKLQYALDPNEVRDFEYKYWPGANLLNVPFPGTRPELPVRINSLQWPVGASRWAIGRYLALDDTVEALRNSTYANNNYRAATLIVDDSLSSITTDL